MATPVQKLPPEADQKAWNFFVFRKSRDLIRVSRLARELRDEIVRLLSGTEFAIDALVRAGELETGLADAERAEAEHVSALTDLLATHVCGGQVNLETALQLVQKTGNEGEVACSHPEGFSYYGLNPLDYAAVARIIAPELRPHVAVIGIRSIGTALGAIVAAGLKREGINADRISVRPEGEPYYRRTCFSKSQAQWIRHMLEQFADFAVVDEGPGFSGSTLLSVTRALEDAGVPRCTIRIICSRSVDQVQDPATAAVLKRYKPTEVAYGRSLPINCERNVGGGLWRELLYSEPIQWPACWTDLERIKHVAADGSSVLKFEGFGRFGALGRDQARALAGQGFSPALMCFENGFARYRWISGRPLRREDLSPQLLEHMAKYCAFRAENFKALSVRTEPLLNMMQRNLEIEFDYSLRLPELPVCRPVYPDCRMMPHEWIQTVDGKLFKTDSVGHAEGHQLPGPVDVAWDLAGVIAEWGLSADETEFFLTSYQRQTGEDASARIQRYLTAYHTYRMAHCGMGAASMRRSTDGQALRREYRRHSERVRQLLNISSPNS
jgi:hypothetical protein